MKRSYTRFSLPGRVVDLLYSDNEFYSYVAKNKKAKEHVFPKYNTWRDNNGFHMVFALAGYSPSDVNVDTFCDEIIVSSQGIQDEDKSSYTDAPENAKSSVQRGYIVRGIARRKFSVKFQICNLFDTTKAKAQMKDGELHIIIPETEKRLTPIEINYVSGGE